MSFETELQALVLRHLTDISSRGPGIMTTGCADMLAELVNATGYVIAFGTGGDTKLCDEMLTGTEAHLAHVVSEKAQGIRAIREMMRK